MNSDAMYRYHYHMRALAAEALISMDSEPFGPLNETDRQTFQRYANVIPRLLNGNAERSQVDQWHTDLITKLTLDGARQIQTATYALAVSECREQGNQAACELASAMEMQVKSTAAQSAGGDDDDGDESVNSDELYPYRLRASAAEALVCRTMQVSLIDALNPRDQLTLRRYWETMSTYLAGSDATRERAVEVHVALISGLTNDGADKLRRAIYIVALDDCQVRGNQAACSLTEAMEARESSLRSWVDNAAKTKDDHLTSFAHAAMHARDNVRGMSQHDKDGLTRLIDLGAGPVPVSRFAAGERWQQVEITFAALSPGARSVLTDVLTRQTRSHAPSLIGIGLGKYGRTPIPVVETSKGKAGCPLMAGALAALLALVFATSVTLLRASRHVATGVSRCQRACLDGQSWVETPRA